MTPYPLHPPVFERLRRIPAHLPGQALRDLRRGGDLVNLAETGNPWGPAPSVAERLRQALDADLALYPSADALDLRTAIAQRRDLQPDQVLVGAGSTELAAAAARAMLLDGGSGLAGKHSSPLFGAAILAAGGRLIESHASLEEPDPDALLAAVQPDTRIVFLGQPDNPTGTFLEQDALVRLARSLRPDILLVLDRAFAEYLEPDACQDAATLLAERPNLLVLHSFSKIHGLASLRIGYALGQPDLLALLERVRLPWVASHLAMAAAAAALAEPGHEAQCRGRNFETRGAFTTEARRHRCRLTGQAGNFLLMETMIPARALQRDLLSLGVLVQPMTGCDLPNHVRVTMGRPQDIQTFWKAAGAILDSQGCGCP
jgi:histidinol-phosphate aminotransferase